MRNRKPELTLKEVALPEPKFYRIYMKDGSGTDHIKAAWKMEHAGVWYGDWTIEHLMNEDFDSVKTKFCDNKRYFNKCKDFNNIQDEWILVYYDSKICLGQLRGGIQTDDDHPLNWTKNGKIIQHFHFREIINQRCFYLKDLPSFFEITKRAGGYGNVCMPSESYYKILRYLIKFSTPKEIMRHLGGLTPADTIDLLGDRAWESFCEAYLILEHNYVPTSGLVTGGTQADYDMIGRNFKSGEEIWAQCKKSDAPFDVSDDSRFMRDARESRRDAKYFWFSYGGWNRDLDYNNIEFIDKKHIMKWLERKRGEEYLRLLLSRE